MNVGMGINSVYNIDGSVRQRDGIGYYTYNLIETFLNTQNVGIIPAYFKPIRTVFCKKRQSLLVQDNVFLTGILPLNFYRTLESKIDVFHSTDYLIPKLRNTPVVATIHDALLFKEAKLINPKLRRLKNYLFKKHIRYADHVIAISHAAAADLVSYWGLDSKNISVVHCGISKAWLKMIPESKRQEVKQKYKINRPFLLSVGTIQNKKNYSRVLDAYMQLHESIRSNFQLIIVGKLGKFALDTPKISSLHDEGHIQWLKYVPFDDLRALYQSALALIFPSLNEGFGLPILEAFASHIPILTSTIESVKEVAADAAYFVDPYSIDSIRTGMEKLMTDSTLRQDLVKKGIKRVKNFSWEKCAHDVMQVYTLLR